MDQDRRCAMKGLRKAAVLAALGTLACSTVGASAYYTDLISSASVIRVASMDFSIDGHGILADLSEEDDRILPLQEGESFTVRFKTVYNGNVDCVAVPCLGITANHFVPGDVIKVSDGSREWTLENGKGDLCSAPRLCKPGDTVECVYTITVAKRAGSDPLQFDYDFRLAAAQASGNEDLLKETDGAEAFEKIKDRSEESGGSGQGSGSGQGGGSGTGVIGFTDLTGKEETGDSHTGAPISDRKKSHVICFEPQVSGGSPAAHQLRWYMQRDGESETLLPEQAGGSKLTILLPIPSSGIRIRYEAENEAGAVSSPVYQLSGDQEGVHCEKQAYTINNGN